MALKCIAADGRGNIRVKVDYQLINRSFLESQKLKWVETSMRGTERGGGGGEVILFLFQHVAGCCP